MRVGAFALAVVWAAGRAIMLGASFGIAWLSAGLAVTSPAGAQGREPVAAATPVPEPRGSATRTPEARMLGGVVAPDEIIAVVRHAGFAPRSRPALRGATYVMFATDHYLMDVRLTIDARSGRLLAATRLAGSAYGGPVYEGFDVLPHTLPRTYSPTYEALPPAYDPTRAAPANVPLANVPPRAPGRNYGLKPNEAPEARATPAGRPTPGAAEQVKRAAAAAPLPRSRPDQEPLEFQTLCAGIRRAPGAARGDHYPLCAPAAHCGTDRTAGWCLRYPSRTPETHYGANRSVGVALQAESNPHP